MADAKRIVVLGASSAIAEHWARLRAARGDRLLLVGRDPGKLAVVADDLRARGAADVLVAESYLADADGAT